MANPKIHPLAQDVPTGTAWKQGRRIYVRARYGSQLDQDLRALGAKWDPAERARWVGSVKAEKVAGALEAVRAYQERARAVADIKARGLVASIPFEAAHIRAQAKELDALWVPEHKVWAMRTEADLAHIRTLLAEHEAERAEQAKQRQQEQREMRARAQREEREAEQERRKRAAEAAERAGQQALAASGRTPTGETVVLRIISIRVMNKAQAWDMTYEVGDLVQLDDGRHGIVTQVRVWFTGEEIAASICWHRDTHDQAHWDLEHEVAVVEDTPEEAAERAEQAARSQDAAELHHLMQALRTGGPVREGYTRPDVDEVAGRIEHRYGSLAWISHDGGTAVLMGDRVLFQHPGYYDDYRSTETTITDPELIERVRAVLARGERQRHYHDQMTYTYTVTPKEM